MPCTLMINIRELNFVAHHQTICRSRPQGHDTVDKNGAALCRSSFIPFFAGEKQRGSRRQACKSPGSGPRRDSAAASCNQTWRPQLVGSPFSYSGTESPSTRSDGRGSSGSEANDSASDKSTARGLSGFSPNSLSSVSSSSSSFDAPSSDRHGLPQHAVNNVSGHILDRRNKRLSSARSGRSVASSGSSLSHRFNDGAHPSAADTAVVRAANGARISAYQTVLAGIPRQTRVSIAVIAHTPAGDMHGVANVGCPMSRASCTTLERYRNRISSVTAPAQGLTWSTMRHNTSFLSHLRWLYPTWRGRTFASLQILTSLLRHDSLILFCRETLVLGDTVP